jgi:hypothetical protein
MPDDRTGTLLVIAGNTMLSRTPTVKLGNYGKRELAKQHLFRIG